MGGTRGYALPTRGGFGKTPRRPIGWGKRGSARRRASCCCSPGGRAGDAVCLGRGVSHPTDSADGWPPRRRNRPGAWRRGSSSPRWAWWSSSPDSASVVCHGRVVAQIRGTHARKRHSDGPSSPLRFEPSNSPESLRTRRVVALPVVFRLDVAETGSLCARQESNLRPRAPEARALSPELRARREEASVDGVEELSSAAGGRLCRPGGQSPFLWAVSGRKGLAGEPWVQPPKTSRSGGARSIP